MVELGADSSQEYFLGPLGVFVWIKVLYQFRLNSLFGPLLTILLSMGKVIIQYSLMLVLLMICFSFTGRILFNSSHFSSF